MHHVLQNAAQGEATQDGLLSYHIGGIGSQEAKGRYETTETKVKLFSLLPLKVCKTYCGPMLTLLYCLRATWTKRLEKKSYSGRLLTATARSKKIAGPRLSKGGPG